MWTAAWGPWHRRGGPDDAPRLEGRKSQTAVTQDGGCRRAHTHSWARSGRREIVEEATDWLTVVVVPKAWRVESRGAVAWRGRVGIVETRSELLGVV